MPLDLNPAQMIGGGLMVLVGLGAAAMATSRLRIQWRWLGCGAMVWAIAMPVKRAADALLSGPVAEPIGRQLTSTFHIPNVLLASFYVGLLTACTLVVYTFLAGLIWRPLAADPRRAIGVGVGIGALEAVYYGLKVAAGLAPDDWLAPTAISATPILILPAERLLTIACHTLVAAMVLYAVATRRWSWFVAGFIFFTALDGLAGFFIITNAFTRVNPWLLELTFAAFALTSIPVLRHLWRHWPPASSVEPLAAPVRTS